MELGPAQSHRLLRLQVLEFVATEEEGSNRLATEADQRSHQLQRLAWRLHTVELVGKESGLLVATGDKL